MSASDISGIITALITFITALTALITAIRTNIRTKSQHVAVKDDINTIANQVPSVDESKLKTNGG